MRIGRFDLRLPLLVSILLSSSAAFGQTRYSMNVVGYYDAQFVAGSNLVANPFDAGDNTISNLFAGLPDGSVIYSGWNSGLGGFGLTNKFASGVWTDGSAIFDRRSAWFLQLPLSANISFVGEAWPAMCIPFPPGVTASGVLPKYACGFCINITDCLLRVPDQTQIVRWDRANQRWDVPDVYIFELGWQPAFPTLAPDEGAMIFNSDRSFTARSFGLPALGQVPLLKPMIGGTNFVFEFSSLSGMDYVVQGSINPNTHGWRTVLSDTATSSGAYTRVVIPMDGANAFFRLHALRLVNPERTGTQFRFDFYAEQGARYRVSRSLSLEPPDWQLVTEIDGIGTTMTATDTSASARGAYYRLEY